MTAPYRSINQDFRKSSVAIFGFFYDLLWVSKILAILLKRKNRNSYKEKNFSHRPLDFLKIE